MKVDESKNYVVRRKPDRRRTWSFQIYKHRVDGYMTVPDAFLSVICDWGTEKQKIINLPMAFLQDQVLPRAYCDARGRFLFEVHKGSLLFNWHHGFKMDGERWLA